MPPLEFEGYFCHDGLSGKFFDGLVMSAVFHVSGSGPKKKANEVFKNPFGHTLFFLGTGIGWVHSCEPGLHPCRYIPTEEWGRYVTEMGKEPSPWAKIPTPEVSLHRDVVMAYVNMVLVDGYDWKCKHDCATMVDEILKVGSAYESKYSNTVAPSVAAEKWNREAEGKYKRY